MLSTITKTLNKAANEERANISQNFFKTGKGQYGEGDIFIGITVPKTRAIAKQYKHADQRTLLTLLKSPVHEKRLLALLILVHQYESTPQKKQIVNFYLKNKKYVNNWDLVDLTAPKILGDFFLDKPREILYTLAQSKTLWDRRIAVVATYTFIKHNDFADILKLTHILKKDEHDLMHKAIGWMLREVGKRDQKALETFLKKHYTHLPRTTLRYAIERFPEKKRKAYLRGEIQ